MLLDQHELTSFMKTTGSPGLHVLVPLDRRADFDEVRALAQGVADKFVQGDPDHLTTEIQKSNRRGRIFVDTARNNYAQTAAPPYAVRPRRGASIAAPLVWDELDDPDLAPDRFNIHNVFERIERIPDPWKDLRN